jgi:hypothetical protein
MKEYTIDDLREDYEQYNQDIWDNKAERHPIDNQCHSSGNFDKIGFICNMLIKLTNKNIELEERVKEQAKTLELQADINDVVISFMGGNK